MFAEELVSFLAFIIDFNRKYTPPPFFFTSKRATGQELTHECNDHSSGGEIKNLFPLRKDLVIRLQKKTLPSDQCFFPTHTDTLTHMLVHIVFHPPALDLRL